MRRFQRISGRNCGIYPSGEEFEAGETPEAKFATTRCWTTCSTATLQCGKQCSVSWKEHGIAMSQIMKRNAHTLLKVHRFYGIMLYENFFKKNIDDGNIIDDGKKNPGTHKVQFPESINICFIRIWRKRL
ncbi:MAG: hypothetical protein ACLUD0_05425 [Eubacterium ramulus]